MLEISFAFLAAFWKTSPAVPALFCWRRNAMLVLASATLLSLRRIVLLWIFLAAEGSQ